MTVICQGMFFSVRCKSSGATPKIGVQFQFFRAQAATTLRSVLYPRPSALAAVHTLYSVMIFEG